jgi:hypothetical protein
LAGRPPLETHEARLAHGLFDTPSILENGASILENGASILENGASILENGASILENGASILENGASILENGVSILDDGASRCAFASARSWGHPPPDLFRAPVRGKDHDRAERAPFFVASKYRLIQDFL